MSTNSPVPSNYSLLLTWLVNFCLKFPNHATVLGYTAAQVTAAQNDCNEGIYLLLNMKPLVENYAAEVSAYIRTKLLAPVGAVAGNFPSSPPLPPPPATTVPAGIVERLRALVGEMKEKLVCTPAIAQDLDIIVPVPAVDLTPPVLKQTKAQALQVEIKWNKQGWTGVKVQSRAPGAPGWIDVGTDNFSPFQDNRPLAVPNQPEMREYRMCHMDGDTPMLNWSNVLVMAVQP